MNSVKHYVARVNYSERDAGQKKKNFPSTPNFLSIILGYKWYFDIYKY